MADARRTRRRIESEKRRAKVTRPQLAALRKRAVTLRPLAVVVAIGAVAASFFVGTSGLDHFIVGAFGVGLAGFLALTTVLRCPACLTTLVVEEQLAPLLPKKVRCTRCGMQAPSA